MDTRSDVYALGVMLYRVLTWDFPYPVSGPLPDVTRHILETPPTPPTRRWRSDTGVASSRTRRSRNGTCPINGELETILLKALAKEPQRRYQSADELGRDIGHYLRGEPIEAKRDSASYVVGKAFRRHRGLVLTAASVALVLCVGWVAVARDVAEQLLFDRIERLKRSLTFTPGAQIAQTTKDVAAVYTLLVDNPEASRSGEFQTIQESAEVELLKSLESALDTNTFGPIARILVEMPNAVDTLAQLNENPNANDIVVRLRNHLECWIRVPPPVGRAGEVQTCIEALLTLDPENTRAADAREELGELETTFRPIDLLGFAEIGNTSVESPGARYVDSENPGVRGRAPASLDVRTDSAEEP